MPKRKSSPRSDSDNAQISVKKHCTRDIRGFWTRTASPTKTHNDISTISSLPADTNDVKIRPSRVFDKVVINRPSPRVRAQYGLTGGSTSDSEDEGITLSHFQNPSLIVTSSRTTKIAVPKPPDDIVLSPTHNKPVTTHPQWRSRSSTEAPVSELESETILRPIRIMDRQASTKTSRRGGNTQVMLVNELEVKATQKSMFTTTSRGRQTKRMSFFIEDDDDASNDDVAPRSERSKPKRKTASDEDMSDFTPDESLDAESSAGESGSATTSSEGECSDLVSEEAELYDDVPRRRKQPVKVITSKSKPASTKPSISAKKKTTKSRMISLNKGTQRALDTSLRPLSNIKDIFLDMTSNALTNGLKTALPQWNGRTLRVATMCSGTESPLLALQLIQEALDKLGQHNFDVVHLFSAEIVPYKQAYIERNFSVPIIFRDITELTRAKDSSHKATTAYGAEAEVPKGLHLLIAGTACVDYSMLNNKQKSMEDNGESGDTFRAVLAYAKTWRPKMLILENVFTAPWDDMLESYENEGYAVSGVLLDTKTYYLPQTRQRGYMLCIDKQACISDEAAITAARQWTKMMDYLKRPASSPASDFMLPMDDPAVLRARALLARRSVLDKGNREVDWSKCAIRHIQYRREEQIGNARPYTSWQESGSISPPDYADHEWFRQQVERVWDMLDCSFLRKALPKGGNYDIQFKSRIINVSQNVDRNPDSTAAGIAPCLTPSGIFFVTDRGATLSPDETIALQGLPLDRISFTTETPKQIQDLAGNAMSSTVVGAAILSAITVSATKLYFEQESHVQKAIVTKMQPSRVAMQSGQSRCEDISNSRRYIDLTKMMQDAIASSQKCACEGPFDLAQKSIQTCLDCGHSSCLACGGKPAHNYSPEHLPRGKRMGPSAFKQKWEALLPSHLTLRCDSNLLGSLQAMDGPLCSRYSQVVQAIFEGVFQLEGLRRGYNWSATWRSHNASLDLTIKPQSFEWQLYASPDANSAAQDELRIILLKPVAVGRSTGTSLTNINWRVGYPEARKIKIALRGAGDKTASWLARLNIPAHRDQAIWNELALHCDDEGLKHINGSYKYLPKCGTASESLYKHKNSPMDEPRFLMLDPDPIGDAANDCCIITDDPRRLQRNKRHVFMQFPSTWRPWLFDQAKDTIVGCVDYAWLDDSPSLIQVQTVDANIKLTTLDIDTWHLEGSQDCRSGIEILTMDVPENLVTGALVLSSALTFADIHWLFSLVNPHVRFGKEMQLPFSRARLSCTACMPKPAPLRWKWTTDMKTLKPYEDPALATRFEESLKVRPVAIHLDREARVGDTRLSVSLNLVTLAHRASGKLQRLVGDMAEDDVPQIHWRVDTCYSESSVLELPVFRLRNNDEDLPSEHQPNLRIDLWPLQQRSLAWMLRQEAGKGIEHIIEEVEELLIPGAAWRVEVTARHRRWIRGGIQASHPGFGKTICTLALVATDFASFQAPEQIIDDFSPISTSAPGIKVAATLIIAPKHLVKQWASEIQKVLGNKFTNSTIVIAGAADLNKHDIKNFSRAKLIVVNQEVLTSPDYVKRLAVFAGVPEPSATKGRRYETWLRFVNEKVSEHVHLLQTKGSEAVKNQIREAFQKNMQDPDFESIVPSKRRTGKAYADWKNDSGVDSDMGRRPQQSSLPAKDLLHIDKCLFEMFCFNRIVVDEFTYLAAKETAAIENLKGDKRWALSATAKLQDPYDIARMANLIGVKLRVGENAPGALSQKNLKKILDEKTEFEQFQTFRTAPSMAVTRRTYELAQSFLDSFVRQNILEFEDFPYADQLVPVQLATTHRLVYTELSQHLNGADMRITKSRKAGSEDRDRDFQILENLQGVDSAEEALSRLAAVFDGRNYNAGTNAATIKDLAAKRQSQAEQAKSRLSEAVSEIVPLARGCNISAFASWKEDVLEAGSLGDEDTTKTVRSLFQEQEKGAPKAQTAKRSSERSQQQVKDKLSVLNVLTKQYMATLRSIRFANNAQHLLCAWPKTKSLGKCDSHDCSRSIKPVMSVSSLCGHIICDDCWELSQTHTGLCNALGCSAPIHKYHLLRSDKLVQTTADSTIGTFAGAKVKGVIDLLGQIQAAQDQAILFVQYEDQIDDMEQACKRSAISCIAVRDNNKAAQLVTKFQTEIDPTDRSTVIILNASNSSAAGVNLTNANNVLFVSPLLTDSQYSYNAALAQAIGRVRRPGQTKDICVFRFVALDTIDVDILEHRERRSIGLSQVGAPDVAMNEKHTPTTQRKRCKEQELERVQLIKDKNGFFRLLPKSWLVGDRLEYGKGIEGRARVSGYEDFSSLVKFSKAYSEED